eukprot:14276498-Ditylum_brightwellii.AAC.1
MSLRKRETVAVRSCRTMSIVAARMDYMKDKIVDATAHWQEEYIPNPPCTARSVAIEYAYVGKSGACATVCKTIQVNLPMRLLQEIASCVGPSMLWGLCYGTYQHSYGKAFAVECSGCTIECTFGGQGGKRTHPVCLFPQL